MEDSNIIWSFAVLCCFVMTAELFIVLGVSFYSYRGLAHLLKTFGRDWHMTYSTSFVNTVGATYCSVVVLCSVVLMLIDNSYKLDIQSCWSNTIVENDFIMTAWLVLVLGLVAQNTPHSFVIVSDCLGPNEPYQQDTIGPGGVQTFGCVISRVPKKYWYF